MNKCWICRKHLAEYVDVLCPDDVIPTVCGGCSARRLIVAVLYKITIGDINAKKR